MSETQPKKVEIVCLGNNGRSPLLHAVLEAEAERKGAAKEISISSSGLYVNHRHPFKMLAATMAKAVEREDINLYGGETKAIKDMLSDDRLAERYETDPEFREAFLNQFDQTYRLYQAADVAMRNNVLARHGLEGKKEQEQFPNRNDLDLVLTVKQSLVEPAKKRYAQVLLADRVREEHTELKRLCVRDAEITSMAEYVGAKDVPGGFGKFDINLYENMYQEMERVSPLILEKVLEG